MEPLSHFVPHWLAWPLTALATFAALAGAVLFFFSAALGDYVPAIWGGAAFAGAGVLWYGGDMAASNRPFEV